MKELEKASPRESYVEADVETASEASSEQDYSYEFAQMEVIMKTLGNNGMIRIIYMILQASAAHCICIPQLVPATLTKIITVLLQNKTLFISLETLV